jgi:hypothetical protein
MEARHRELVVRRLARVLPAAFLLCAAAAPAAAQDGAATGTLLIGDERVELRHAYALAQPGFFDKSREDVKVVISNVALDESSLRDPFALIHLARERRLRAIEVVLDAEHAPIGGAIYDRAFDGMVSVAGMHVFEPTAFERKRVAGRLHTRDASSFRDVTFSYDVTFDAAIPRPPTPDELTRALASPPALAGSELLSALRDGNFQRFRALLAAPLTSRFEGSGAEAEWSRVRAETPADSRVVGLREDGPQAVATINGTRDGIVIEFTVTLVERDGEWRVVKID